MAAEFTIWVQLILSIGTILGGVILGGVLILTLKGSVNDIKFNMKDIRNDIKDIKTDVNQININSGKHDERIIYLDKMVTKILDVVFKGESQNDRKIV